MYFLVWVFRRDPQWSERPAYTVAYVTALTMDSPSANHADARVFPLDAVHYARKSARKAAFGDYSTFAIMGLVILLAMASVPIARPLLRRVGMGGFWGLGAILLLLLLAGIVAASKYHWFEHRRRVLEKSRPDNSARLWCIGLPQEIEKHGPFVDAPFEPQIFWALLGQRFSRRMWVATWLIAVPVILSINFVIERDWFVGLWENPATKLYSGFAVGLFAAFWLWPSYFRIVPGRLDVIRFSRIGNRVLEMTTIGLRNAIIIADLPQKRVFISIDDGATKTSLELAIRLIRNRTRLVHTLFWAALCTHDPPALPDDQLLG